jgi:Icc-related predicted phosphoesterase
MFSIMNNTFLALFLVAAVGISCSPENPQEKSASAENHVALELKVPPAFRFVAFGDTRFHDPSDTEAANAAVRRALVAAIDKENPAFISIGGDVVYVGENPQDWQVWDSETAIWREHKIPVYPAIGNHDLKGNLHTALSNYFARFPELQDSRFYSVRLGNSLMLVLDSALDEVSGPQSDWLRSQLDHLSSSTDFVFLVFHHPPYTSSSDDKAFGGGHSARATEQALAKVLEDRQPHMRARIVVFNGHVHNYERHEHGGITYFVTGGGGAHAYPIARKAGDLYKDGGVNYHYLIAEVDHNRLTVTMHKLEFKDGKEAWSQPDSATIVAPAALPAAAD